MASHDSDNPDDFLLPDLGEGLEEAELLEWCVKEGDEINESDMVAKMETAKAVVEVFSPRAGTLVKLHGNPGDTIKVGSPLLTFKSDAAAPQAPSTDNGKPAES